MVSSPVAIKEIIVGRTRVFALTMGRLLDRPLPKMENVSLPATRFQSRPQLISPGNSAGEETIAPWNVNNCEEKRLRVREGEIQKVFSLFNMMDISSRPLTSLGERGLASNFLQSTASILILSICPSLLYFSIRTPEHPDNHSMAANPQSRPR